MKALFIATVTVLSLMAPLATAQKSDAPENVEVFKGTGNTEKSLQLSVTVEAPEHLLVKEDEYIREGQPIADKPEERKRLDQQRTSLVLQKNNLFCKQVPEPLKPKEAPQVAPLPSANYQEEESFVAQAQLKLQQAQAILAQRIPILKADNPEKRASMEKVEAQFRGAQEKVKEQEELLKSMQDMQLQAPIIRHEEAKLKQLQSETEQLQSALQREQALMASAGTQQQQELQNLEIAVQVARSDLQIALGRLDGARNNRKLIEYKATIESAQRVEEENRSQQTYSQQLGQYAQAVREKDYQLTQLHNQLIAIDDKLAQIPIIRAPRSGFIRRIKNWVGNNGKYTTTLTIGSSPNNNSSGSQSNNKQNKTTMEATPSLQPTSPASTPSTPGAQIITDKSTCPQPTINTNTTSTGAKQ
ncbi:hypothetical protein NIES4071_106500 (plasmid) [Calothrix sp. NIES-4071]|nr:hypothetical protein NIES4071_106500 [Calothrix sp. NIES-4071]BAZ65068.1 hypothetical protein NIES4105_108010 [Calothrix sp. NIES-4105]